MVLTPLTIEASCSAMQNGKKYEEKDG